MDAYTLDQRGILWMESKGWKQNYSDDTFCIFQKNIILFFLYFYVNYIILCVIKYDLSMVCILEISTSVF